MKTLSIVTNVYCAEKFILESLRNFRDVTHKLKEIHNIKVNFIAVDDGSHDNTAKLLKKEQQDKKDFHFIKLSRNFGAVYCLQAGIEYAESILSDAVVCLASDMQDPPALIIPMVEQWLSGNKFIICVRKSRHDPVITKFFSRLYYKLFTKFVIKNFPKKGFDMMLLDKQVLAEFIACNEKNFTPQQLVFWLGFKPYIIEYDRQERAAGKSTWTFSKKFKLAIDTFVSMSYFPVRFMSGVGLTVAFVSFLYGLFIIIGKLSGNIPLSGWASITVILSFLLGLNMMMVGVIGEYLWRVLDQVRDRPKYVVDYTLKAKDNVSDSISSESDKLG